MQEGHWEIFHHDNSNFYKPCICGHRIKRISYLYDSMSKKIMYIGTTCLKKYGITRHLNNRILIQVLKNGLYSTENISLDERVKEWIQKSYHSLLEKVNACSEGEFDYYDVVAPFRRLLNDVCELVTEYNFDLILLLKSIESDVNSMNKFTKHHMIDVSDSDTFSDKSISTIDIDDAEFVPEMLSNTVSEICDELSAETLSEISELVSEDFVIEPTADELSADTLSEISELVSNDFVIEPTADELSAETLSEESELVIGNFVIETDPSDMSKENEYNEISSEGSAETHIEANDDVKEYPPLLLADTFCKGYVCHPSVHTYCILKMRMNELHEDIKLHRGHIRELRKEVNELCTGTQNLHSRIFSLL
jgi:hypothetical protein